MRFLKYLLVVLVTAIFAAFAIDNRQIVSFSLFPLPYETEMPLFVLVIICFALGAAAAGTIAFFAGVQRKLELGKAKRHLQALENEVGGLRAERNILPAAKHVPY